MKKWYESKTMWVAILQGVFGILLAFETQYGGVGFIILGKSIIDFWLRYLTTKPIEDIE